jgi:hypothetical protein
LLLGIGIHCFPLVPVMELTWRPNHIGESLI